MNGVGLKGTGTKIPVSLLQAEQLQKAFFDFVERNAVESVADFLIKNVHTGKVPIDARNENGETPLTVSCRLGHETLVQLLIRNGADPDAKDLELWSPLLNATKNGSLEIVRMLVDADADIEQADVGSWTPLFWAVYKNRFTVVQYLVEQGAETNIIDEYGMAPLLWAAGRGYFDVLKELLMAGTRVNIRDRFGNNGLFWACKKGSIECVTILLDRDCPVDVIGVNGMTPLIIAVKNRHKDIVQLILDKNPNVNTIDQGGLTALSHASHVGDAELTEMLLEAGSYVNITDRKKETVLMKAVKSGQIDAVRILLSKYADIDAQDEEGRTALHLAIDKGYPDILALLVGHKPNTELRNKEGDTPLLKAVRCRNIVAAQLLMQIGAKVAAADKRGDTSLHIALRSRSRRLTQILLSRPQDSRLLYQPNKNGETPYSIDQSRSQPILPHIFGPAESQVQTEAMLGYDVYSNILADILCEPMLSLPLTVGLYAKWGSGKSFLLNKLKESLNLFSRSWMETKNMTWSWMAFWALFVVASLIGVVLYSCIIEFYLSLGAYVFVCFVFGSTYAVVIFGKNHYSRTARQYLNSYFIEFRLLNQILFYHPPSLLERELISRPVGFIFADFHRLSSVGGIESLGNMIETLYVELENLYGALAVRLCTAFSPPYTDRSKSEARKLCGVPICAIVLAILLLSISSLFITATYFHDKAHGSAFIASGVVILLLCMVVGCYPLSLALWHACRLRPRRQIRRALAKTEKNFRMEGLMQKLSGQVQLLEETVRRLDSYSSSQTRLVLFIDGLDSCEQDKMLQTLDAIQVLFCNKQNSSFIIFIAVDPHIVVSAVQKNMGTVFLRADLSGHDYLKNLIHMPFYLHNAAIQKLHERLTRVRRESFDYLRWKTMRSDAIYGSFLSLAESKSGSSRLRRAVSQNLQDQNLGEHIINDDYFTNINPRSMRRVVNSITLSGRLMRAFETNFNWIALGHWISLVEQWPYRLSWMMDYCEHNSPPDSKPLKEIYDAIKSRIPGVKSDDSLLEIDRNPKNLEFYLENNREPVLTVGHLRNFVPFTSNLDPYLRKLIHDKYCGSGATVSSDSISVDVKKAKLEFGSELELFKDTAFHVRLSRLSVDEICALIKRLPVSSQSAISDYCSAFKSSNVSGLVLAHCDLEELKSQCHFTFGDWTLISLMIKFLRTNEAQFSTLSSEQPDAAAVRSASTGSKYTAAHKMNRSGRYLNKQSVIHEQALPSDMAEVSTTHDWLQQRLGYLDQTEFSGDREIAEASPRTSRRSSAVREERSDDLVSVASFFDSNEILKRPDSVPGSGGGGSGPAGGADQSESNSGAVTKSRVQGLVKAITGTIEETNQLLVHMSSDESDVDEEDTEAQSTVRRKANGETRPSLFDVATPPPQRTLSDPVVNG